MNWTRREFLTATSAVAIGAGTPGLFGRAALAAPKSDQPGGGETILVVVQLTGGNDGLNTVIPVKDPAYAQARPTLKQSASQVLKIDDQLAFHPSLEGFSTLLEKSQLSILQGVGYPQASRSHFEAMDVWHRATPQKDEPYGWLGRAQPAMGGPAAMVHVGGGEGPLALLGAAGPAPSLKSLSEYRLRVSAEGDDPDKRALIQGFAAKEAAADSELLSLVRNSARETYKSAERLLKVADEYKTPVNYPESGLAQRLKLIAQLISAELPERVYYTSLDGFDTHAVQADAHANLLKELSEAVSAFQKDVEHHGQQRRVLLLTFSEFGRRVKENGSQGTDHGAASQMFAVGATVKPGPIGKHPSLTELDRGDLTMHTDFRSVYATILDKWLRVPAGDVLQGDFPPVDFLG